MKPLQEVENEMQEVEREMSSLKKLTTKVRIERNKEDYLYPLDAP